MMNSKIQLNRAKQRRCGIISNNLKVQLQLETVADLSSHRRVNSMTECLMRHFAALQETPLPDCCCKNPDRTCGSKRSENPSAFGCKTNTVVVLLCSLVFVFSERMLYNEFWEVNTSNNKVIKSNFCYFLVTDSSLDTALF